MNTEFYKVKIGSTFYYNGKLFVKIGRNIYKSASGIVRAIPLMTTLVARPISSVQSGGGSSSSESPVIITEPSFWWNYQNIASMLDLVTGLDMPASGGSTNVAGIISNGGNFPPANAAATTLTTALVHLTAESFSHNVWIKFVTGPANDETVQFLFYRDNSAGQVTSMTVTRTAGVDKLQITAGPLSSGSGSHFQEMNYTIDANWHMFTIVCNGVANTFTGYVDAVEVMSVTKIPIGSSPDWFTGAVAVNPSTAEYVMDERGFWKGYALTPTEITALYNSGAGRTWPFS